MPLQEQQFEQLKSNLINSLRGFFPIVGRKHEIDVDNIWIDDNVASDDFPLQVKAYDKNSTFSVPVYADLLLKNISSGKVIDRAKKVKLINLPKITSRGTYIVDGNEYQVPNQLLLKPNVYNRIKEDGQLETFVNIKPVALHLFLDPKNGVFSLKYGNQKTVSLYHFLRGLGLSDSDMSSKWGPEVLELNKQSKGEPLKEVSKFYEMIYREEPMSPQESVSGVLKYINEKDLDREGTKLTLGTGHDKLSADILVDSATKLLNLNKGIGEPDEKDALHFKRVASIDDFIPQRLENEKRMLLFKIRQRIDSKDNIKDIIRPETLNRTIKTFFTGSNLSSQAKQLNPLSSFAESNKLTIMGEGGIENEQSLTADTRAVHPSQLGFVDPIHTPESDKIGVVNQLSLLTAKKGNELITRMINARTGKVEEITPIQASQSIVSFADQFNKDGNKFLPKKGKVVASVRNKIQEVDASEVDYILVSDKQIFSIPSNMAPFVNHISGNRSMMSGKHMEQALPLKYREAPLVQNKMTSSKTFENFIAEKSNAYSKVDGVVDKITNDAIYISDGKNNHIHHIYNKFISPSDKVYYNHTPTVSVGDHVKKGQLIAESNYSKDGTYATGTNLTVAISPYKGYTFEDGIVVSESAAKKLTSLHMYREKISIDGNSILDKSKFLSFFPTKISGSNFSKLNDRGIIKEGANLEKGDIIVAHLHKEDYTKEDVLIAQFNKKFLKPYKDRSISWDKDYEGKVIKVIERPKEIEIQVETEEPAVLGDKLSGRAGNKGIITHIIPQNEVPTTESGQPIDVFINPHSIVGRINPAQILEVTAGKIADKKGKPYIVDNFGNENYLDKIEKELNDNGIVEKEKIKNPDGSTIDNPVAVGKMHVLKLNHPVSKKFQVRETGTYTANMQPTSGGGKGASKVDQLTIYSMLSHGAVKNLQEEMTVKSEKNDEFWHAYQAGLPLPKPKVPFVFDKFENYLKASGINMERHGDELQLSPLTNEQVEKLSNGEITDPEFIQGKNLREIKGGLFDPEITGGSDGTGWGHISLSESIPNPVFEDAIKSILGIKGVTYEAIVSGKEYVDNSGIINNDKRGITGGEAIKLLLSKIDIDEQLRINLDLIKKASGASLNSINKKIRYLKALKNTNNDATVYVNNKIGVLPPKFRPITPSEGGRLHYAPSNPLYKNLMLLNSQLKLQKERGFPDEQLSDLRKAIYDSYGALVGTSKSFIDRGDKEQPGFLQEIAGKKPKEGFFQDKMLSKRQDFSARSTVIPEPGYNIDDVGLPEEMVWSLYKPFVVRRLQQMGYKPNKAIDEVESRSSIARGVLEQEVKSRPVMLNRAPSLHKFSVMAFNPKITQGKAIRINPLVVEGFNMDFDGDSELSSIFISIEINELQEYIKNHENVKFGVDLVLKNDYLNGIENFIKERKVSMPSDSKIVARKGCEVIHINLEDFPRIEDSKLVKENGNIIYEVPPGISIFTCDNDTREVVEIKVTEFSIHPNLDNSIVSTMHGDELFVSDDHSLISYDFLKNSLVKTKPCDILGVAIPKVRNIKTETTIDTINLVDYLINKNDSLAKVLPSVRLDEKLGHFIGMMVGDGWVSNFKDRTTVQLCFSNNDDNLVKAFDNGVDLLLDRHIPMSGIESPHQFDGHESFSRKFTKTCTSLGKNIENWIGSGARNKHLPHFFLSAPEEFRLGLLAGLIDTDGSTTWTNRSGKRLEQFGSWYSTISERLADEVVTLCRSLGISSSITISGPEYRVVFSVLTMHDKNIKLRSGKKSADLRKYQSSPIPEGADRCISRNDHVPFHKDLFDRAKKIFKSSTHIAEYTAMKRGSEFGTISRRIAKLLIEKIDDFPISWINIVNDTNITWTHAIGVKKNPNKVTMYDITAPGPYTFMTSSGVIVQDTAGVHVPVSDDAVQEARRMVPSQNLFNPGDNSLVHKPGKEQITGLYLMTKPGEVIKTKYSNIENIVSDYKDGKLKLNNVVDFNGPITVGSILINSVLPDKFRDKNRVMTKKELSILLNNISKDNPQDYGLIISRLKDLGNEAVYQIGLTTGLSDLKIDYSKRDKIIEAAKKELANNGLSGLSTFGEKIKDVAKKSLEANDSGFNSMVESGAKGKEDAVTQMVATPFLTTDHNNKPVPFIIERSYSEGLKAPEYWSTLSGSRKGMMDRVLSTSEPGAFTKELINNVIGSKITEHDCGTKQGVEVDVHDRSNALGRYTIDDKLVDAAFLANYKGSKIKLRSPLTCEAKSPPCAKCFGLDENGKLPVIGTYIGTIAGQAMTEPSTQMLMRAFHTGGSVLANKNIKESGSGEIFKGFERVEQVLELPKNVKGKAILSEKSGIITAIIPAPQGGFNVTVSGDIHYVPGGLSVIVKIGEHIKKGDRISSGTIKPQELATLTNPLNAKQHMVDVISREYKNEGRDIRRPLIETVVNSFTNKGQIVDSGKSSFIPGDIVNINKVNAMNKDGDDIKIIPIFQGINQSPFTDEDFLARLNFQQLKKSLKEGASQGWKSDIAGTNPIPGLVHGSEFGNQ